MDKMLTRKHPNDLLTEILTALYVFIGIILLSVASRYPHIQSIKSYYNYKLLVLAILLCSLIAALANYLVRSYSHKHSLIFTHDINCFTPTDWYAALHGFLIVVFGLVSLSWSPASSDTRYALMLVLMATSLSINTYFHPYFRNAVNRITKANNIDTLKCQHKEWSAMFGNTCIGLLVAMGGAIYTIISLVNINSDAVERTIPSSVQIFMDGILIGYCVLAPPILWLLRPMHVAMVQACNRIDELGTSNSQ